MTRRGAAARVGVLTSILFSCCASPAAKDPPPTESEPDPVDPVQSCLDGVRAANERAPADRQAQTVVTACYPIWPDEGCRQAWLDSLQAPAGTRAKVVALRCVPALCDSLEPAPPVCSRDIGAFDLLDEQFDWLGAWTELGVLALNKELGLPGDAPHGGLIARRMLELVSFSSPAPLAQP